MLFERRKVNSVHCSHGINDGVSWWLIHTSIVHFLSKNESIETIITLYRMKKMQREMYVIRIDYDISIQAIKFQLGMICTNRQWRVKSFLKSGQFFCGLF